MWGGLKVTWTVSEKHIINFFGLICTLENKMCYYCTLKLNNVHVSLKKTEIKFEIFKLKTSVKQFL